MLNREEELVFRAALLEGDAALRSWRTLMERRPVAELDFNSQRTLPLVFRNFERQGIEVPELPALKSVYRWVWSSNQTRIAAGRGVLERLREHEIDAVLLKGASLLPLDYEDAGVRFMADFDVLVRPEAVDEAVAVLARAGWTSRSSRSRSRVGVLWEDELVDERGQGLDLHWRVFMSSEPEEELWRAVVPVTLGGVPALALGASDRLLHVCVHGFQPHDPPAIRWVADAATVIRRHAIDWDRVVDQARRRQVSLTVGQALGYVSRVVEAPVPAGVVESLNAGPHTRLEVAEFDARPGPSALGEVVRWNWYRYRRVQPRRLRAVLGFPHYLRVLLGYDRRRDLARHVVARLSR
jgi:hypothetical protein